MNIFQIWKEIGESLPFLAKKGLWSEHRTVLITKIEIKDFPFGNAFGISCNNGYINSREEKLPSPGVYSWYLVSDKFPKVIHNIKQSDIDPDKNIKAYSPSTILEFGKHKNCSILQVFCNDPKYLEWLILNKEDFTLSTECISELKKQKKDFWFNKYLLLINYNKLR